MSTAEFLQFDSHWSDLNWQAQLQAETTDTTAFKFADTVQWNEKPTAYFPVKKKKKDELLN